MRKIEGDVHEELRGHGGRESHVVVFAEMDKAIGCLGESVADIAARVDNGR